MNPPIYIGDLIAEIQCSFRLLQDLYAPNEGPWSWEHPVLLQWMQLNGFETRDQVLDNPAATYVVLQSLRQKIQKCKDQGQQLDLPIVVTPHWGAWVDPQAEVA